MENGLGVLVHQADCQVGATHLYYCQRLAGPCGVGQSLRIHQAPYQSRQLLWGPDVLLSSHQALLLSLLPRTQEMSCSHSAFIYPGHRSHLPEIPSTCSAIGAGLGR
jgi:hypothetical protein